MPKTLLDTVNDVLQRAAVIQGDVNKLTSLTQSSIQTDIDIAVRSVNETIAHLYELDKYGKFPTRGKIATGQITLVQDQREYPLAADVVSIEVNFRNESDRRELAEYPGGYRQLLLDQRRPSDFRGWPGYYVMIPKRSDIMEIRVDRDPRDGAVGKVYNYEYRSEYLLNAATDKFGFADQALDALTPAILERWNFYRKGPQALNETNWTLSMATTASIMRGNLPSTRYGLRSVDLLAINRQSIDPTK